MLKILCEPKFASALLLFFYYRFVLILQIFDIIGFVYQYLKLLRQVAPQEWIFRELQDIGNMEFRFAEEQPQDDYAAELAGFSSVIVTGIWFFMEYWIFEYVASFFFHCHCFLLVHLFPLSEFYYPIKCREFTYISSRACYLWGLCAQDMGWGNGQISSWFLHTRKHEDRCDIKVLYVSRYVL